MDKNLLEAEVEEALEAALKKKRGGQSIFLSIIGKGKRKFILNQIFFIETAGRKALIHTKDEEYSTNMGLGEVERMLDDAMFYRCHKSYIVNLDKVDYFDHKYIYLYNKARIYLSSKKYSDMRRHFLQRCFERSDV